MYDKLRSEKAAVLLSEVASDAGAIMLENGAEIYRVEDTVERIIRSKINAKDVDVYSTFNVIILSFTFENEVHTNVRRVKNRGNKLFYVDKVNQFSRDFCAGKLSLEEALIELKKIKDLVGRPLVEKIIGGGVAAGGFSLLISGGTNEMFISFVVGMASYHVSNLMERNDIGYFVVNYVYGVVVSLLTMVFANFVPDINQGVIIISSMMALLPGIMITNAMRDLMSGDATSGLTGAVLAILISTALAMGVGTPITIMKIWG
ncbi:threonine/serine exporter ThrE family protein [uncultured Anaerococcus sp.]|uniref:threonine/serine ThrE exporter family protein n=1 Tax=uncultured Anaerococcus sp. TaxID=293428 RepID=UPI0025DA6541|nr:threonine/serine exporter family protein [uncultured Anaerococcus sp.]